MPEPSGSPARSSVDDLLGTSSAAFAGGPSRDLYAPIAISVEKEETQEEPGQPTVPRAAMETRKEEDGWVGRLSSQQEAGTTSVSLEGASGDDHTRTGPSAGSCASPQGLPPPTDPFILIKKVHKNYRKSLCVPNHACGVAILDLFCFFAGRYGMLTLRGPSPPDSDYFVVSPEAKCSIQACSCAAGLGADVSSWEVSRASLCPTAHLPAPLLLPTAPSAPTSRSSVVLTA